MYAPKPAICGNGHAAMQRTQTAVIHSLTGKKTTPNKQVKEIKQTKDKR